MKFRVILNIFFLIGLGSFSMVYAQPRPGIRVGNRVLARGETITICVGSSISYFNEASGSPGTRINWRFNNGSPRTSNDFSPQGILYNTGGIDTTWQIVVDGNLRDSTFVLVRVNTLKPTAVFTHSPNGECASTPVVFTNTSSGGNNLTYRWDFGDGRAGSTASNPSRAFETNPAGPLQQNFSVKLVVTNDGGCTDSVTRTINVRRTPDPSIDRGDPAIQFGPLNGVPTFRRCENIPSYRFAFSNATQTPGQITQYTIQWGDGGPDSTFSTWPNGPANNIFRTYPRRNTPMTVRVRAADGCEGVRTYNVFVGTTPSGGFASQGNTSICAPNALSFSISEFANNAPGTQYKVTVNDNTPPQVFLHPPPNQVSHIFQNTSCGQTSSNGTNFFQNSYGATLDVENPCGATSVSVIPIYVSGKPKADFFASPDTNICVNTSVFFGESNVYGGSVTPTGGTSSTCVRTGKMVWAISPATGYVINNGTLGSVNGRPDNGFFWTEGSRGLSIRFNQTGTYRVKIYAANEFCGVDSTVKEICVRNPPTAAFTLDKNRACVPAEVAVNNTSPTGPCGGENYSWSIRFADPENCGGSGSFDFLDGTNARSRNPKIRFNNPGRYIVELRLTTVAAGCTSPVVSDTFFAAAKPVIELANVLGICAGNTLTPAATVTNCYGPGTLSYAWSFTGGTPATSDQRNPGAISYSGQGSFPLSLRATNGCGFTDAQRTLVVAARPVANAGPDREICSGVQANLGSTSSPGVTYTWRPSTGLAFPNQSNTTVSRTYTGPSADTTFTYIVKASLGSDCESEDTVLVTVKRAPVVTINPAVATLCAGGAAVLEASGADSYVWAPSAGLSSTNTALVTASPSLSTQYTVRGILANGCESSAVASVTIIARPVVSAGRDTLVCNNAPNITLTGSPAGGVWSGHPNVSAAGVFNPRAAGNGNYTLTYLFNANNCDGTDSLVVRVQDPPAANAGVDFSVCADGSTVTLTGAPAGGRWSGSALVTAAGQFTASTPGVYNLIYQRGSGSCIGYDTLQLTVVEAVSNNTISATQGYCAGVLPAPLRGSEASAGGLTLNYQWQSSPDSLVWQNLNGENGRDLNIPVPEAAIYYRRLASTAVCAAGSPSNVVRIFIHPNASAVLNPPVLVQCPPFRLDSVALNPGIFPDRNGTYRWFANGNLLGSGTRFPGFTLSNGDDSVAIKLLTISRFGCVDDSASVIFRTLPSPTPSFTLSDTVGCGPLDILISNTTPQASRYYFIWDFGTGQTFEGAQPGTIRFPENPNKGDTVYTVRMRATGGCDTLLVEKQIRVRARPRTIFTPDAAEGCSPFTVTFNNNSAGSNASFIWDFGDGSPRIPATAGPVSHTFFTGVLDTFQVRLFSENDCGLDTALFALVVNPNRVRLDFAVNGNELNGCAPHTVRFINNTTGANLFRWDFGDGTPELTTNRGFDTLQHIYRDTGTFRVRLFATNGCSDTTSFETIRVVQGPRVAFTLNPSAICLGEPFTLTNTSDAGLAWNWDFGDSSSSTQRNPIKNYTRTGTFRVVLRGTRQFAQGFGCTDSATATIIVSSPTGDLGYRGGYHCLGNRVSFEVTNSNATTYRFYFGNGDSLTTTNPAVTYLYPQPGNYLPSVRITENGCSRLLTGLDTVRIDRIRTGFVFTPEPSCGSTLLRFTDTSTAFAGIASRRWFFGDGTFSTQQNPNKIVFASGTYPVSLRITGISGCIDSVQLNVPVAVEQFPVLSITGDTTACVGFPAFFTANTATAPGPVAYSWQMTGGVPSTGNTASNTWFQPGSQTVTLIGRTTFGCADTVIRRIVVNPTPVVNAGNDVTICRGQSIRLNALAPGSVLQWSPQQGLSCTDCSNPIANPNLTTQYVVQATNIFGCRQSDTVVVNVAQPFRVTVTPNDTICASVNETAQLFASGAFRYVWSPAVGLTATGIPNPIAAPASTTRYRVVGFDAENCFTDTAFVTVGVGRNPTVQLPPGGLLVAGTQITLTPALNGGPFSRYTWTPDRDLSCNNCPNPVATINNNIQYRLEVETIYGCRASDTVSYTVQCQLDQVYIPNAFTPDGDGVNDVFMVRGKGVSRVLYFRVYNRFGQVVFERSNVSANDLQAGWDGRINGVPASPDVYVFTAEILCTAGARYSYKGNVTLFR